MSVSYVTSGGGTWGSGAGNPATFSIAPTGGGNLLIVSLGWEYGAGQTCTGVTYNGDALTGFLLYTSPGNLVQAQQFIGIYSAASATLEVTMSAATNLNMGWASLAGVNPTSPYRYVSGYQGTNNQPGFTVSQGNTAVGDVMVECIAWQSSGVFSSWNNGQTEIDQERNVGTCKLRTCYLAGVDTSQGMKMNLTTSKDWAAALGSFRPAAAGGILRPRSLTGGMSVLLGGMQG